MKTIRLTNGDDDVRRLKVLFVAMMQPLALRTSTRSEKMNGQRASQKSWTRQKAFLSPCFGAMRRPAILRSWRLSLRSRRRRSRVRGRGASTRA